MTRNLHLSLLAAIALCAGCHDPSGIATEALEGRGLREIQVEVLEGEGLLGFTARQGQDDCSGTVAVARYDDASSAKIEMECLPPGGAHTGALPATADADTIALARRCDGGTAAACTTLAQRYHQGEGLDKDIGTAKVLYTQGCSGGDGGGCYELAQTIQHDPAQAKRVLDLLVEACDMGHAVACGDAAQRFYNADVQESIPTMARMARKGCDDDNPQACLVLGVLNAYGVGMPLNMEEARKRLMQACGNYLKAACDLVETF